MSEIKFELLPNEILFECFKYFNMIDIFHSFDQLNNRFTHLIRNIRFSLNFENIKNKFQCEEFCHKLSIDETIRNQLYSLHLSNKNTFYPIHLFISKFSLLQFSQLHSLSLHQITSKNWKSIRSMLSLMTELISFRMIDCCPLSNDIISHLPMSQLQILVIPFESLPKLISNIQFSSIRSLSISKCNLDELSILFDKASKLNYLKIEYFDMRIDETRCFNNPTNNLRTLHINENRSHLNGLFMLLEQTPYLENLIILRSEKPSVVNAYKWQNFIISSLVHLKNFKFQFNVFSFPRDDINEQSLKEFQNDFWCDEHHWYTEYIILESWALIYTIPYTSDMFELPPNGHRYYNQSINHMKTFINIKELIVDHRTQMKKGQYYFSNVESLLLGNLDSSYRDLAVDSFSYLDYLQTIINLSNIKHLTVLYGFCFRTKDVFKEIFKSAIQLTSLTIYFNDLLRWLDDDELCKYLNKSIRKLKTYYDPFKNSDQLEQFCKTFANIEQLKCSVSHLKSLLLIKYLPKLTYLRNSERITTNEISSIKNEIEKLGLDITAEFRSEDYPCDLYIWINRI